MKLLTLLKGIIQYIYLVPLQLLADTTLLYRPTGQAELDLIAASGYRYFPPRLPEQPLFYPVLTLAYATKIAQWNATEGGVGYVLQFKVRNKFLNNYRMQLAGGEEHQEYWIPADKLPEFNDAIVGKIKLIKTVHNTKKE